MSVQATQSVPAYSDDGTPIKSDKDRLTPRLQERSSPDSTQGSRLAKQWKFAHIMAYISCFSSFIISTRACWNSTYQDCDNESPYGQAYEAGLYSGLTCVFAHTLAYGTWTDSRKIGTKAFWTVEAKQSRMARMPIVVGLAAVLQVGAAGRNGLAVWRTVGLRDESRLVSLVVGIAV